VHGIKSRGAQASRLFAALLSLGPAPWAASKEAPPPPVVFALTLREAPIGAEAIPLLPANDVLLRHPATPRTAIRTTAALESRDKDGIVQVTIPGGSLMIEASILGIRGYCGLALRSGANKYRGDVAVCGIDSDDDGNLERLVFDNNFTGRLRSPYEIERLLPFSAQPLAYRRLATAELPRSDVIVRHRVMDRSAFLLRRQLDVATLELEVPAELISPVADASARRVLLLLDAADSNSKVYEVSLAASKDDRRIGPYAIKRNDAQTVPAAVVTSAPPPGDIFLGLEGYLLSSAIPSRTFVLKQQPVQ
jgi:hypothetical protein